MPNCLFKGSERIIWLEATFMSDNHCTLTILYKLLSQVLFWFLIDNKAWLNYYLFLLLCKTVGNSGRCAPTGSDKLCINILVPDHILFPSLFDKQQWSQVQTRHVCIRACIWPGAVEIPLDPILLRHLLQTEPILLVKLLESKGDYR